MAYPYQSYQNPWQQGYYQNPYYPQQQMPQIQQQPPAQQPQSAAIQSSGIIWVNSDSEAAAFPVAPNTAVRLWHSSLPVVYFKQADASGKPTMKIYDLVEHKDIQPTEEKKPDFATKEDFASLDSSIQSIKGEIKMLKKELKKKEANDDDE